MRLRRIELTSIEIDVDGAVYDLHNDFAFRRMIYDMALRTLRLEWERRDGAWVPANAPRALVIVVDAVSHLACEGRDPAMPFTEDDCLSEFASVRPDVPVSESVMLTTGLRPDWHLVARFMSGFAVRVQGEEARCELAM